MRARIIRAYIAKPKKIPLISLISQQTVPRDKRDKRVIFPLDSYIYARAREWIISPLVLQRYERKMILPRKTKKYELNDGRFGHSENIRYLCMVKLYKTTY